LNTRARETKIRVVGLTHVYEGRVPTHALQEVNLEVYDNEFLAIVGPSGCGKTTFLNIVAGFIKPTKGYVQIGLNKVIAPSPEVGFVFQEDALFPWMTVKGNIEFGLLARGVDAEEREVITDGWIKLIGLDEFKDALPRELSAGMSKMVELARTLAVDPPILLLDEPFGSLDAQTRLRLQDELSRILEETKKTVILVTHDVDEAIYLADRVVVFSPRPGRVKAEILLDLPRPRSGEIRLSPRFLELKRRVWRELGIVTGQSMPIQGAERQ
jgi:NitT/TauT family transport system ATP-binding protein